MRIDTVAPLKKILSEPKKIVIVTHWSPDGDAIGSSLGLKNYLIQKQHDVTVITPNQYPAFLKWMEGNDDIIVFEENETGAVEKVAEAELIFCLDFNTLKRIDKLGEEVENATVDKCMIDHHLQPDDFAKYMLHDVKSSSTCELVVDFISLMDDEALLNKAVGECLYTGMVTDTGSFRFPSTGAGTHRSVAKLIDSGTKNGEIHSRLFNNGKENRLRLLGYCLSEKMTVLPDFGTAFFAITEEELNRYDYQKGDTDGVVNYALSIKGIHFAAFIVQRDGAVKMSFRSQGDFDVNVFARENFNGGGHANAAGGISEDSLDETITKFVSLLSTL